MVLPLFGICRLLLKIKERIRAMSTTNPTKEEQEELRLKLLGTWKSGDVGVAARASNLERAEPEDDAASAEDILGFDWQPEVVIFRGKKIWVHSLSGDDILLMNSRVAKELNTLRITDLEERQNQSEIRLQVWSAILACRKGPGSDAPEVFKPEHAAQLRQKTSWAFVREVFMRLQHASNIESGLTEVMTHFFGLTETSLDWSLGELKAGRLENCRSILEVLVSFTSLTKLQKQFSWKNVEYLDNSLKEVMAISENTSDDLMPPEDLNPSSTPTTLPEAGE